MSPFLKGVGMVKKYIVSLSEVERESLEQLVKTGKRAAYTINHARILLKADQNQVNGSWQVLSDRVELTIQNKLVCLEKKSNHSGYKVTKIKPFFSSIKKIPLHPVKRQREKEMI